jgi:hypothetical protein
VTPGFNNTGGKFCISVDSVRCQLATNFNFELQILSKKKWNYGMGLSRALGKIFPEKT